MMPAKSAIHRPAADRELGDIPYGGLFGDTVMARVVEEIVADPRSVYHLKDLEGLTGNSAPRIREALATLVKLGLLKTSGGKHPAYTVDISRRSFVALTLLAYAVLDDRRGSDCMETAIRHYREAGTPGAGGRAAAAAPGYLSAPATRQLAVQIAEVLAKKLVLLDDMTRKSEIAEEDIMAAGYKVRKGVRNHYRKKAAKKTG
jgi:hypothetical protein